MIEGFVDACGKNYEFLKDLYVELQHQMQDNRG